MHLLKFKWLNSINVKVLIAYMAGATLSVILLTLVTFWVVTYNSNYLSVSDLRSFTEEMARRLDFDDQGIPIGFEDDSDGFSWDDFSWVFRDLNEDMAYRVMDANGNILLNSDTDRSFWPSAISFQSLDVGHFEFDKDGSPIQVATTLREHKGRIWSVQFGISSRMFTLMHNGFALPFMGIGIIVFSLVLLFIFGICIYFILKHTLKPLRDVSESSEAISLSSIHERLLVSNVPLEIVPLVESFNRVLERLEHGYRIQQEFLSTAAHELKTPLALIRGQVEVYAKTEEREELLNDVAHMTRQVQQLLVLAEVSEVQNYKLSSVNIVSVVQDVVGYLSPLAKKRNVTISVVEASKELWNADQSALFVLLKNLLENAIQHSEEGSHIELWLRNNEITCRDWGAGIEPELLPNIFVRFWRGEHRRDCGAGLGLAICKEIAQAHKWKLIAENSKPGMKFTLTSP